MERMAHTCLTRKVRCGVFLGPASWLHLEERTHLLNEISDAVEFVEPNNAFI